MYMYLDNIYLVNISKLSALIGSYSGEICIQFSRLLPDIGHVRQIITVGLILIGNNTDYME